MDYYIDVPILRKKNSFPERHYTVVITELVAVKTQKNLNMHQQLYLPIMYFDSYAVILR